MEIRKYREEDLPQMIEIWNYIVDEGNSFPQEEHLDMEGGRKFFSSQSYTGVASEKGKVAGLYILHPNNVGRCGHIGNASYAVDMKLRGKHIGEQLVLDSIKHAREAGFRLIQFNAVVKSNTHANHLYERLGFKQVGMIPQGFRMKNGTYEDIALYYYAL